MAEWRLAIAKALAHVCTFNLGQTENRGECGLPGITGKVSGGILGDPLSLGQLLGLRLNPRLGCFSPLHPRPHTLSRVLTPQLLLGSARGLSGLPAFQGGHSERAIIVR